MRPFYDARVESLGPQDFVVVECVCGHTEKLTAPMLLACKRVEAHSFIQGMDRMMRCRKCDEKGKVLLSIKWA
jgi:hypothetical protein